MKRGPIYAKKGAKNFEKITDDSQQQYPDLLKISKQKPLNGSKDTEFQRMKLLLAISRLEEGRRYQNLEISFSYHS